MVRDIHCFFSLVALRKVHGCRVFHFHFWVGFFGAPMTLIIVVGGVSFLSLLVEVHFSSSDVSFHRVTL